MKLIKPRTEIFINNGNLSHVQRIASLNNRTSFLSKYKSYGELVEAVFNSIDVRLLTHASFYYIFKTSSSNDVPSWLCVALTNSPQVSCLYYKKDNERIYFVVTNGKYLFENPRIAQILKQYEVTMSMYIDQCDKLNYHNALNSIRYSVYVSTQLITAYYMNLACPSSVTTSEVIYDISVPSWYKYLSLFKRWLVRMTWKITEYVNRFISKDNNKYICCGNYVFSNDSHVQCVYTMSFYEWKKTFDSLKFYLTYRYDSEIDDTITNIKRDLRQIHNVSTGSIEVL